MYGKTIQETQSYMHKNQRNPRDINGKSKNITENQRKAKESKTLKGNQRNLLKLKIININPNTSKNINRNLCRAPNISGSHITQH